MESASQERRLNDDVPVEVLLKYALRERDALQEKLNMIIPYAKGLEERVRVLQQEMLAFQKKDAALNDCARVRKLNKHIIGHLKQAVQMYEDYKAATNPNRINN